MLRQHLHYFQRKSTGSSTVQYICIHITVADEVLRLYAGLPELITR
jgi:hypothetical protein